MLLIVRGALLVTSLFFGIQVNAKPFFTEIRPKSVIRVEPEGKPVEEKKEDGPRAAAAAKVAAAIVMMDIPGGEFLMGSDNGLEDERPVHKVKVRPFRLAKYEGDVRAVRRLLPGDAWQVSGRWPLGSRSTAGHERHLGRRQRVHREAQCLWR